MVINKHNRLIVWFVNKKFLVRKKRGERQKLFKSKGNHVDLVGVLHGIEYHASGHNILYLPGVMLSYSLRDRTSTRLSNSFVLAYDR